MLTAQSRVSRVVRGVLGPLSPPSLRSGAGLSSCCLHLRPERGMRPAPAVCRELCGSRQSSAPDLSAVRAVTCVIQPGLLQKAAESPVRRAAGSCL